MRIRKNMESFLFLLNSLRCLGRGDKDSEFILWSWLQQRWRFPEIEKFKGAVACTDGQMCQNNLQLLLCCYWLKKTLVKSLLLSHTDLPFTPLLVFLCILPSFLVYCSWTLHQLPCSKYSKFKTKWTAQEFILMTYWQMHSMSTFGKQALSLSVHLILLNRLNKQTSTRFSFKYAPESTSPHVLWLQFQSQTQADLAGL